MSLLNCLPDEPAENVPMHPDDYGALLAWVRAKEEKMSGQGA
jgi:hypothetical protein